jgi:hypothetical protein
MIVWGGCCAREEYGDGAAYDPRRDRWRLLPDAPIDARTGHTAVWTGADMIVWGGHVFEEEFADGALYNPDEDRWRLLPEAPAEPRYSHSAVWARQEMIVWGGATLEPTILADGAAFGAGWSPISRSRPGRSGHSAVWTGDEMLVWGGCCGDEGSQLPGGSAYEPMSDTWRALPESGPAPRAEHIALAANGRMLVWGGVQGLERLADGALYEPITDVWSVLPPAPIAGRSGAAGVWTGEAFIVWGGCCDLAERGFSDGAALRLPEERPIAQPTNTSPSGDVVDPEDSDSGVGALIALGGLVLLIALVAGVRALRRRNSPVD